MFQRQRPVHGLTKRSRKPLRDAMTVASLDVGAAKTVCFIAELTPTVDGRVDCEILGAGHCGANPGLAGSRDDGDPAFSTSVAFNARERAIRQAVETAEQMAGERVEEVYVCVPAAATFCKRLAVELPLPAGFVTAEDIGDCVREGQRFTDDDGAVLLHSLPVDYHVDGDRVGMDPRGHRGAHADDPDRERPNKHQYGRYINRSGGKRGIAGCWLCRGSPCSG